MKNHLYVFRTYYDLTELLKTQLANFKHIIKWENIHGNKLDQIKDAQ